MSWNAEPKPAGQGEGSGPADPAPPAADDDTAPRPATPGDAAHRNGGPGRPPPTAGPPQSADARRAVAAAVGDDGGEVSGAAEGLPALPGTARPGGTGPGSARRVSMAELESHQLRRGVRPGDKYMRRARPLDEGFRRLGPGHLEALPRTLEPTSGFGRAFGALKRLFIGSPLSTAAAA